MLFALLHEFAHVLIGVILGFKIESFEIMPFGFCIDLRSKIVDYRKRVLKSNMVELKYIFIAIAGPILNAIFVIIFGNCNFIVKEGEIETGKEVNFKAEASGSDDITYVYTVSKDGGDEEEIQEKSGNSRL